MLPFSSRVRCATQSQDLRSDSGQMIGGRMLFSMFPSFEICTMKEFICLALVHCTWNLEKGKEIPLLLKQMDVFISTYKQSDYDAQLQSTQVKVFSQGFNLRCLCSCCIFLKFIVMDGKIRPIVTVVLQRCNATTIENKYTEYKSVFHALRCILYVKNSMEQNM